MGIRWHCVLLHNHMQKKLYNNEVLTILYATTCAMYYYQVQSQIRILFGILCTRTFLITSVGPSGRTI